LRFHKTIPPENKKPAEFYRLSGPNLKSALIKFAISGKHLRRRALRVMMVMAVMEMRLHSFTDYCLSESGSTDLLEPGNEIFDALHQDFTFNSRRYDPDESGLISAAFPSW
jgi:hypothetical protein